MQAIIATAKQLDNHDIVHLQSQGVPAEMVQGSLGYLARNSSAIVTTEGANVQVQTPPGRAKAFIEGLALLMTIRGVSVHAAT